VARALDVVSGLLVVAAGVAFSYGVYALGQRRDLVALYLLVVGGLCLKAATELLRPKSGDA
jgi:hypothetical protein